MRDLTAQDFLRAEELSGDLSLSGAELKKVFWHFKEAHREAQRQQAFWKSVNDSMTDAYKKLALFQEELRASREELRSTNERLEQRVAERTSLLAEAQEFAESIVASVSDSLIITSPGGVVTRANPATTALLGLDERELMGRSIGSIVEPSPEGSPPLPEGWLEVVLEGGQVRDVEARYVTKSGRRAPVVMSAAKVLGARGDLLGVVCAARDVTERERTEQMLKEQIRRISSQQDQIRALFTPIIKAWDRVLILPIVGALDRALVEEMTHRLLHAVVETRSRFVILDLTGIREVDAESADHLLRISRAAALLGSKCLVSGQSPAVARTFTELNVDLRALVSFGSLSAALAFALRSLESPDVGSLHHG